MARNHNFFFEKDGTPRARGPAAEKMLMAFLEKDVQGSDHICRDLMEDLTAIEDGSDDYREFTGAAHQVVIEGQGVTLSLLSAESESNPSKPDNSYHVALKHFREILEDWEAFILDDQIDDPMDDEDYL